MSDIQITRISKPDRNSVHEHITHLGDCGRMYLKWDVICWIEDGETTFYTMIDGKRADIRIREVEGFKYVQAAAEDSWNDDLLALPSDPPTERARHATRDDWAGTTLFFASPPGDSSWVSIRARSEYMDSGVIVGSAPPQAE